ncbi:NAD(P)/FAD-dependent oxidoreductase [Mesorhizobium sophorae]|uniref:NAD(P)/FAD-dependent oxidoreductase n=1 Tax=Mesorhizobium sophorae TaxID=1300294 RepID=UPI000BA32EAF|nr:FAD-binding oxidoreductase [Mesorhizobium sophorae]
MTEKYSCDVLVVGAGIAGAGAAYYLSGQKLNVIQVETDHPASGPTGSSSAVCHYFYLDRPLSLLAKRGIEILKDLPGAFDQSGVLWACGQKTEAVNRATVERIRNVEGSRIEGLTGAQASELLPHINMDGITFAAWEDESGHCDPYGATNELVRRARESGVKFLGGRSVTDIHVANGQTTGVTLSDGSTITTERVILATGVWSKALLSKLGVNLPVYIERHFMAVMSAPGIARKLLPHCWVDDTYNCYARPEGENTILIGAWGGGGTSVENEALASDHHKMNYRVDVAGQFDRTITQEESIWIINHLMPRSPEIAELGIRPGYACQYDMSADHLPVVDEIPGANGLFVIAGSSGHGFKIGPAMGEAVAKWALGERQELMETFSMARFA